MKAKQLDFACRLAAGVTVQSILAATTLLLPATTSSAGTLYWDGAGADNNWLTLNNWGTSGANNTTNPASVPGSSDDVVFYSTGGARLTTGTLNNSPFTLQSLTFGNGVTGAVTVASGGASGTITLNGKANYDPSVFGSGTSANLGTVGLYVQGGTPTLSGPVVLGGSQSWLHNGGNTLTVNSLTMSGSQSLALGGNGSSFIALTNGITGASGNSIDINRTGTGGRVSIGGTGSNYAGTVTVTKGFLSYTTSGTSIINKANVTIADSSYTTGIGSTYAMDQAFLTNAINNGDKAKSFVVTLGADSNNNLDFSTAGLTNASLGANAAGRTYSGTLTPNGSTYRLGGGGSTLTVTGNLTGGNSLAVVNSVTLTPASANNIGAITLSAGTLTVSSNNALGGSGDITSAGGSLTFAGGTGTSRNIVSLNNGLNVNSGLSIDLSGTVSGTPTIGASGSTLTFSGTGNNAGFGGTWNSGTLVLNKDSSASVHAVNAGPVVNGATVRLSGTGGDQILDSQNMGLNTGTFDLNGKSETIANQTGTGGTVTNNASSTVSTLTLGTAATLTTSNSLRDGTGTLAITKAGAGVVTFAGANTFSGGLNIQNGTIIATAGSQQLAQAGTSSTNTFVFTSALPTGTAVGQTVVSANLPSNTYITAINSGTKTITLTNAFSSATTSVDLNAWQSTGNNTVTLGVGATNGTLDLNGTSQTVTGLSVGAGAAAGSQTITNNSSTTDATLNFNGTSSAFGGVIKDGSTRKTALTASAGTLDLSAINTYTNGTTVSGGKLTISAGNINATSGISIGAGEFNYNSSTALSKPISFTGTGGKLSGTGTVNTSVTVAAGNFIAPGNSIGTMTIANTLTIAGTASFELNKDSGTLVRTADKIIGITAVPNFSGGTLSVSLTGGGFAAGDTWDLFDWTGQGTPGGTITNTFTSVPTGTTGAPSGFKWNTSQLYSNGIIGLDLAYTAPVLALQTTAPSTTGGQITAGNAGTTAAPQGTFSPATGNTLTITGGSGSYTPASVTNITTGTNAGYVAVSGFSPGTDANIYLLNLKVGGANPTSLQSAQIASDLSGLLLGNTATSVIPTELASIGGINYDVMITFPTGVSASQFFGLSFAGYSRTGTGGDGTTAVSGVTFDAITVIPEPGTLVSAVGFAAGLLAIRRRRA